MNLFTRLLATAVLGLLAACAQQTTVPAPAAVSAKAPDAQRPSPLILVSIDGFRPDYLQRGVTPTLAALISEGAFAAQGMQPSFPSVTFSNHYTLVTGLTPDRHGIVWLRPGSCHVAFTMSLNG